MYVNNYNFSNHRQNLQLQDPLIGSSKPLTISKLFPDWVGTCHECDLYLLFGFPFMPKELLPAWPFAHVDWEQVDKNASQLFGSFFRQFIKYS